MSYAHQLPNINELEQLAKLVGLFPANAQKFIDTAKQYGFSKEILIFLRFFRPSETFNHSLDFITRCEEMELLIKQKWDSHKEALGSSEG